MSKRLGNDDLNSNEGYAVIVELSHNLNREAFADFTVGSEQVSGTWDADDSQAILDHLRSVIAYVESEVEKQDG